MVQAYAKPFTSVVGLKLWLGSLGEADVDPETVKDGLELYHLGEELGLDTDKLACVAHDMLSDCVDVTLQFKARYRCKTIEGLRGERYRCPCEEAGCETCGQPGYVGKGTAAYLDSHTLCKGHAVRSWPLNGELWEHPQEVKTPKRVELVPASYLYLESIGLGRQFHHLAGRESKLQGCGDDVWKVGKFSTREVFELE